MHADTPTRRTARIARGGIPTSASVRVAGSSRRDSMVTGRSRARRVGQHSTRLSEVSSAPAAAPAFHRHPPRPKRGRREQPPGASSPRAPAPPVPPGPCAPGGGPSAKGKLETTQYFAFIGVCPMQYDDLDRHEAASIGRPAARRWSRAAVTAFSTVGPREYEHHSPATAAIKPTKSADRMRISFAGLRQG